MKFKQYLNESDKDKVEIIKNQIENDFGSFEKAKKQAKELSIIWWKKYDKWNSLPKNKKLISIPPTLDDIKIENKKEGYKFYYINKNPNYLAKNGKGNGFYIDIKSTVGIERYKLN